MCFHACKHIVKETQNFLFKVRALRAIVNGTYSGNIRLLHFVNYKPFADWPNDFE